MAPSTKKAAASKAKAKPAGKPAKKAAPKPKAAAAKAAPAKKKPAKKAAAAVPKALAAKIAAKGAAREGGFEAFEAKWSAEDKIELKYWDGRGLMEVPRVLFALAGKFPGDYVDGRYGTGSPNPLGPNAKLYSSVSDTLGANLGRMPILEAGGESVGQSAAINYYVATELDFMGSTTMEAAQIIGISEHLKECNLAYRALMPYGSEPTKEAMKTWFTTGATDTSPAPADMSKRSERNLPWWLGRIEYVVGDDGFAVGGKLSLADVLIYNMFAEYLKASEAAPTVAQYRREPFGSKKMTDAAMKKAPNLLKICRSVAADENMQKWLATRGVQGF